MEINCIEDYTKYVFQGGNGWKWLCEVDGPAIYYKIIYPEFVKQASLQLWYTNPDKKTMQKASKLIIGLRDNFEEYNPVFFKIRTMEKRFQMRAKHA